MLLARVRSLEASRGPARFELVSDVEYVVQDGVVTWMGIPADMNGFHLIGVGIYVISPPSTDITLFSIADMTSGFTLLLDPATILAGEFSSYTNPSQPQVDPNVKVSTGQRLAFTMVDATGSDAVGLAISLTFG